MALCDVFDKQLQLMQLRNAVDEFNATDAFNGAFEYYTSMFGGGAKFCMDKCHNGNCHLIIFMT